ncbi:MAG TPA: hypothetical protein VEK56_05980 [Vicinamibacterales bacterium]|nr:hypothetical protein [Vicinamibacterales bacterium]
MNLLENDSKLLILPGMAEIRAERCGPRIRVGTAGVGLDGWKRTADNNRDLAIRRRLDRHVLPLN